MVMIPRCYTVIAGEPDVGRSLVLSLNSCDRSFCRSRMGYSPVELLKKALCPRMGYDYTVESLNKGPCIWLIRGDF